MESCFVEHLLDFVLMVYLMLQAELKMGGIKNVCMHNLSPGMVTTELLMSGTH